MRRKSLFRLQFFAAAFFLVLISACGAQKEVAAPATLPTPADHEPPPPPELPSPPPPPAPDPSEIPSGRNKLIQEGVLPGGNRRVEVVEAPEEEVVEDEPFFIVEQMPAYPGCEKAENVRECSAEQTMDYIAKHTIYPEECRQANIMGTVYIGYEINRQGEVQNVKVLRSAHTLLDAEAARVVKSLLQHTPGTQRGKPVVVKFTVPIKFKL